MFTVAQMLNGRQGLLGSQLSAVARNGRGYVFTSRGVVRVTTNSNGTLTMTLTRVQRRRV